MIVNLHPDRRFLPVSRETPSKGWLSRVLTKIGGDQHLGAVDQGASPWSPMMFKRPFFLLLFLLAPVFAWAQEPKAVLSGPTRVRVNEQILLSVEGSVSEGQPEIAVDQSPAHIDLQALYTKDGKLIYGMTSAKKPGMYRFTCMAWGKATDTTARPPYSLAILDVEVYSDPVPDPAPNPNPNPPGPNPNPNPPGPNPNPPGPTEKYGLQTFTKQLISAIPWTPAQKKPGATMLMKVFTDVADSAKTYKDPTSMVVATSNQYKQVLGPDYTYWKDAYLTPLKNKLADLTKAGTLPSTPDAVAEAWREIATALKEFTQ
jgi:hypothetical protein